MWANPIVTSHQLLVLVTGGSLISQTTEYALRAVMFLALHEGKAHTTLQIAGGTRVPQDYLSKVLQALSRGGIVTSQRGLGGGFTLALKPKNITLLQIIEVVDPIRRFDGCEHSPNHDHALCQLHQRLDDTMLLVQKQFAKATIQSLISANSASITPLCTLAKTKKRVGVRNK